jgi:transcriptional regulator with XRE-family HTH domain
MKLSDWRKQSGFTQKDVADAVGIDATMVSKYERELAKPTVFHLAIIQKITNNIVTVEDFLYGDEKAEVDKIDNKAPEASVYSDPCEASE